MIIVASIAACLGLIVGPVLAVNLVGVVPHILRARRQRLSRLLPPSLPVEPDPVVEALKADLRKQFAIEEIAAPRGY